MQSPIDTGKVTGRRQIRFDTIDDAIRDARAMVAADRDGRATRVGNWTVGQILGHVATWCEYSYTGSPLKPPWFVKLLLRPMKNRFLYKSMRAGVKIPRVEGGTLATDDMPAEVALAKFERAFKRIQLEPPTLAHPIFGPLSHDQWINGQLRHAEVHHSFVVMDHPAAA